VLSRLAIAKKGIASAVHRASWTTPEQQGLWRDDIYKQIREVMPMQGSLKVEQDVRTGAG
jgi:hypothetical protein